MGIKEMDTETEGFRYLFDKGTKLGRHRHRRKEKEAYGSDDDAGRKRGTLR